MVDPYIPVATRPRSAADTALSTFLITDIEGSTRLWEEHASTMGAALAIHDGLLRSAIGSGGGAVIKSMGDGMLALFDDPVAAINAALVAQRAFRDSTWGPTGPLRVRMAIHAGTAESRDGDYFGPALNRDARILAIGHGGQILLSAVAAVLAREGLPESVELIDCGSHRLRDLDRPEQIFQVAAVDLPRDFPPLRSMSTRRSNLPGQLSSFIGRERELAEVEALLRRARLVTLIGTGGTGKTRLMLEVAGAVAGRFVDGAWLAELAPLGDPAGIAPEIARALGVPEVAGRPTLTTVAEFLASKDLLLLVDNAEHLIDGVADIAGRLLAAAPGLRILATSREALAVPGEAVVQVPSLSCPAVLNLDSAGVDSASFGVAEAEETEAVRLFLERAAAVLPSFVITAANVGAIGEICRRLDGIPLAIELAAARVSAMSPEDIALGLGDRFRLLTGGRRTAMPRQQTLHALIDWSWDLLTDNDRRLLRRLSIFAGGWSAAMAARVVGETPLATRMTRTSNTARDPELLETLDGLARLVDRSLVIVERGATTRYRMLETIRQYARERLIESGEAPVVGERHLASFLALAEAAESELHGPAMVDWLDRLDAELENLGTALEWGLESTPELAIRLAVAMLAYWRFRIASPDNDVRVVSAIDAARRMIAGPREPDPAQRQLAARLFGEAATVWALTGRADVAVGWARDALDLARSGDDSSALVSALVGQALASVFSGQRGDLREWFAELRDVTTQAGDWWNLAVATGGMAGGLASIDPATAESLLLEASAAARRSGNPYAIAMSSMGHGRLLGAAGRVEEARPWFDEAIARFAELGDERFVLACRSDLAHALRRARQFDAAMAMYRETIGRWIRLGNRGAVSNQLENIAFVASERGDALLAARLLGAAEALRELGASPMAVMEEPEYLVGVDHVRASADPATIDVAWMSGRAMSMAEAAALAIGT